ncbi:DUF1338 domain-containing protein [Rapidithrix thailandica]|uniref:2-oxoadipate dioxygenase/decarboxylase n=1 Tax=Rapidithrix thailandica TaxID=413964 RepID=A0AAW9S321_9BACT
MSSIQTLEQLLGKMWRDYVETNPPAQQIHDLIQAEGNEVLNDHIAFRTFNHPKINIDQLAKVFKACGYEEKSDYYFTEKKLYAKHFEHSDETLPRIFISELQLEEFDEELNTIINSLVEQIAEVDYERFDFSSMGRPWELSYQTYQQLKEKSEYAAWTAAFGFRPNHFTVNVNALKTLPDLESLNAFLKEKGFKLNDSGGEIKGSKEVYLEQSSTLAYNTEVVFSDGKHVIPACYYEFAKRYPTESGKLYSGFVAKSADKIFESTDRGQ